MTASPQTHEPLTELGTLIRKARREQGLTQLQLAQKVATSQSAITRIEQGNQNLSMDTISRISDALNTDLLHLAGPPRPTHLRVSGGNRLAGTITVNSSKNAAVALLCASLLNSGRTLLKGVADIVEVDRIVAVLRSLGVSVSWSSDGRDLEILRPENLDLTQIDVDAARRTRSIIMFFGPLLSQESRFSLPYAGGCDLGTRTVEPHMIALRTFGLEVTATDGAYQATTTADGGEPLSIVLTERGDTVTENAIMAAAGRDGVTTIRNASPNYMVQDLCFYLELLGVRIDGIGSTTLVIHGRSHIATDVEYHVSEDPVEAMSLITAGIVTDSEITVSRVPIEFMEIELAILREMGLNYELSGEYAAQNGRTRLVDVTVQPSTLRAPIDTIHPMPFPGLNIDNLPFFVLIAACANGNTTVHDWVFEGRAIHLTDLTRLGAKVRLLDPHRLDVTGPTRWSGAEVSCPPALRPAVVILLAMLAAKGTSVLRGVDIIARGYEQLADRLIGLGACIEPFRD